MKIKTDRPWNLEVKVMYKGTDTIDIIEHHEGADPSDSMPFVVIPIEAIDEVIRQLLRFKNKCGV